MNKCLCGNTQIERVVAEGTEYLRCSGAKGCGYVGFAEEFVLVDEGELIDVTDEVEAV